jgi:hypothetical protein
VVGSRHFDFHGESGETEVETSFELSFVAASVDDLDVVDAHHGKSVPKSIESRPGLEIAHDEVRFETVFGYFFVHLDVFANALGSVAKVQIKTLASLESVAEVSKSQSLDLFDLEFLMMPKPVHKKLMGASRDDHANFVSAE